MGYSTPLLPYQASPIVVAMGLGKVPARAGMLLCLALAATYLVLLPLDYLWFSLLGRLKPGGADAYRAYRNVGRVSEAPPATKQLRLFRRFCCFNDHRESVSFQGCAANQRAVDVRLGEQLCCVAALTEPPYWMITCSATFASALAMWSRMNLCTA
jgi:hypothetical protein